jgi:hypothetical protein
MPSLCSEHTLTRAAWQCTGCDRYLCPECAVLRKIRNAADATVCAHCGNLARVLVLKKNIDPYWKAFPRFVRAMFSGSGIVQLFAVAVVLFACSALPGRSGRGFGTFIFVSYYFQVIRRCAQGLEHLPEPDDFTGIDNYWVMSRFSLASALIWAPAVWYIFRNATMVELMSDPVRVAKAGFDIWAVVLFAAGIIYYPAAIITAAIAESILAMLNPLITVRMMMRIPGQYFVTVLVWLSLAGLDYAFSLLLKVFGAIVYVPIFTAFVATFLKLPLPILGGFILGRLIYQNAEDFGVVKTEVLYEPEVPGAKPRGTPRAASSRAR